MNSQPQRLLDGHTALVTGASSGIGLEVARGLADAGAAVAVNFHSHGESAQQLVDALCAAGGRAIAIGADVSDEDDVAALFAETVERLGPLDLLVANSGIQKDAAIAEMSLADWQAVIDVNLTGQFLCCREAVRRFRAQGRRRAAGAIGRIVCMSSVHEVIPWAGRANYAAAKGGVHQLMQSIALEVAGDGIRVNAVAPGAIRTPINREAWDTAEGRARLMKLIPYRRIGEPEDVARAVAWLASDQADYVTGTTLYVDGGMALYPGFLEGG